METTLFDYNQSAPLDIRELGVERRDGVAIHDIAFDSPLGGLVSAYLVEPDGEGPHAGVVYVHWYEIHTHNANRTQFVSEAVELAKEGTLSLLVDTFWKMSPKRWVASPRHPWRTHVEFDTALSIKQVVDLRRALDVLLARPDVDTSRIGFVGHDFGAMYGALVAGVDERVKAYVLMAGTITFSDWFLFGSELTKAEEKQYIQDMSRLDPTNYIAHAAPAALLFQFAHADVYVPERTALMFFDAASEPKQIVWYEAQHDLNDPEAQSRSDRVTWLRKQLELGAAG